MRIVALGVNNDGENFYIELEETTVMPSQHLACHFLGNTLISISWFSIFSWKLLHPVEIRRFANKKKCTLQETF